MASSFPGAIDSFTDPLSSSPLNSPSHSAQHADLNDAVEKIETKLGVGAMTIGEWTSFTPTLTQSGAVTKTVTYAKYTQINKLCICNVRLEVTGAGTTNNAITIGLPLTCSTSANVRIGIGTFYDGSTTITYNGAVQVTSTTTAAILPDATNNFAGITPNVALANGDNLSFSIMYETT